MADFPELEDLQDQLAQLQIVAVATAIAGDSLAVGHGQVQLANIDAAEVFPSTTYLRGAGRSAERRRGPWQGAASLQQATAILDRLATGDFPRGPRTPTGGSVLDEINANLRPYSLPRVSELIRRENDAKLNATQKLALAISGWLTGDAADTRESLTSSLIRVRSLVQEYLVCSGCDAATGHSRTAPQRGSGHTAARRQAPGGARAPMAG